MTAYFSDIPTIVSSNRILYTATSFARSSLLHLQEIGELRALRPHTSRRSNLSSYLFFTVLSGSGTLTYNDKAYPLQPGSCVFIDCNQSYSHTTPQTSNTAGEKLSEEEQLWSIKWIHFNGPSMDDVYSKYLERGGRPVFNIPSLNTISNVWEELFQAAGSSDYLRDMKINQYLAELLVYVMAESWHPEERKKTSKRSSVLEIKEWIDQNYNTQITLDDLSSLFFINKYYLSKSFKEQFGVTIINYLTTVRITKAKQLLRFTDKTLDEIGELVGITPARYFSEVFSSIEGVAPSVYRKQW